MVHYYKVTTEYSGDNLPRYQSTNLTSKHYLMKLNNSLGEGESAKLKVLDHTSPVFYCTFFWRSDTSQRFKHSEQKCSIPSFLTAILWYQHCHWFSFAQYLCWCIYYSSQFIFTAWHHITFLHWLTSHYKCYHELFYGERLQQIKVAGIQLLYSQKVLVSIYGNFRNIFLQIIRVNLIISRK